MTDVKWDKDGLSQGFTAYKDKVRAALKAVAQYWQGVFEAYAKENAPWTDRTGHARQSLHAWVEALAHDTISVWLSHGVRYGLHLEARNSGRYAIVWPTIEEHLAQISKMLKGIFG